MFRFLDRQNCIGDNSGVSVAVTKRLGDILYAINQSLALLVRAVAGSGRPIALGFGGSSVEREETPSLRTYISAAFIDR